MNNDLDQGMIMMGSQAEIILLSADAISSKGKDGSLIEGMSVFYTFNTRFERMYNSPTSFGQKPGKIWMDYDKLHKIVSAPAKYIGSFQMKIGSDGKPVLTLKDIDYICDVALETQLLPFENEANDPNYPKYAESPKKDSKATKA